jgi:hypothetical protein
MENLITFFKIIAWVLGIGSSLLLIFRIIGAATYTQIDELRDQMNGIKRTFPIMWPAIIALVCWAFIIAF